MRDVLSWIIAFVGMGLFYYIANCNNKRLQIVFFGTFFLFLIYSYSIDIYELNHNYTYTIAETNGKHFGRRGKRMVNYYYFYNENKYVGEIWDSEECLNEKGERHFIKISKSDPTIEYFINDKLVPDSIKEPPINGWDKLPVYFIKGICKHNTPFLIDDDD